MESHFVLHSKEKGTCYLFSISNKPSLIRHRVYLKDMSLKLSFFQVSSNVLYIALIVSIVYISYLTSYINDTIPLVKRRHVLCVYGIIIHSLWFSFNCSDHLYKHEVWSFCLTILFFSSESSFNCILYTNMDLRLHNKCHGQN